jgi:hypothetical protein
LRRKNQTRIRGFARGSLVYGLFQVVFGFQGIEYHLGSFWAWVAVAVAFMGFFLPISIGSFYGAVDVHGWGNIAGAIFAFPAIIVWVVAIVGGLTGGLVGRFKR